MTLDDLIAEIAERGWLVSNLFQLASGLWQANLRTESHHTEFGIGTSAIDALTTAIDLIETATESPKHETCARIDDSPIAQLDIFALMSTNLQPTRALNIKVKL
jgi:hypothetical protein